MEQSFVVEMVRWLLPECQTPETSLIINFLLLFCSMIHFWLSFNHLNLSETLGFFRLRRIQGMIFLSATSEVEVIQGVFGVPHRHPDSVK